MNSDPDSGLQVEKVLGLSQGDHNTINNNFNFSSPVPSSGLFARSECGPLRSHDGCWRFLITIQQAMHAEGGNNKADQAFSVDVQIVEPDASKSWSLQQLNQELSKRIDHRPALPSLTAIPFENLEENLIALISIARNCVLLAHGSDSKYCETRSPEMLVIVSLGFQLNIDCCWIDLLVRVKKGSRARPPVAMACLTRQTHSSDYDGLDRDNIAIEDSDSIAGVMKQDGSRIKDLRWLLIDDYSGDSDHESNPESASARVRRLIAMRMNFQEFDHVLSRDCQEYLHDCHALWLRWPVNGSEFVNFSVRLEKIIKFGIPLFLIESTAFLDPDSVGHLLDWNCKEFVASYCKRHRRPGTSNEDSRLAEALLYWEDHRYKPLKITSPLNPDLFNPFTA